ncbi:hypothetical protein C9I56_11275 [Paraburkholderia caribensis]|uniref:hypothetical protein n=1 Tax=Paraburkholderia caribensis TaxID=75105 RepID=UPI000D166497|nr:hypothetical protein [Paraburkholderia caribensis]PTB28863.1 hypothetical protein C9I56_11275 [Paraburkholderia caribensis]
MPKLNPNHPVTQQLDDEFMHKMCAILVMKAGGRAQVTLDDLQQLRELFDGEMATLVTHAGATAIDFTLVPESKAMEMAREAGGLPQ